MKSPQIRVIRKTPFLWLNRCLIDDLRPSWRATIAYIALAYYAHGDSESCKDLSIPVLAKKMSVSADTMRRGLAELKKKGAIEIRERWKPRAKKSAPREQLPNEYTMLDLSPKQPI